jgi:hypothetical protein
MELRSCYFCGRTGEGLDAYPVVPERLAAEAAPADPARVVLCPDCRSKLRRVLEIALADARDPDPGGATPGADGGGGGGPEVTFDAATAEDGDGASDDESDGDPAPDRAAVPTDDEDETTRAGADGEGDGDPDTTRAGADGEGDAARATDDATDEDEGDGERSTDAPGLGAGAGGPYRKALRLLQNREFPMERAALVEVMSSAYDLDAAECERIVEFAIERGALVDDGGTLRRA